MFKAYQTTGQVPWIFAVWLPFHLIALCGISASFYTPSWTYLWYFLAGWAVFGGLGTAIMLHRVVSHRSLQTRTWMKPILLWISCMAGQGSPIWWAALHRGYHHAHSDREKDIHTPNKGKFNSYMGWFFKIRPDTVNLKHGVDLLRDPMMVWFHKNYNKVVWSSLLILFLIDPMICVWFYVIPSIFGTHTDSLVNTFCHLPYHGYRRFETKDQSRNIWYLGYFGWGQGWHNNHHADPRSYDFGTSVSKKWFEFDPCLLWVPIIAPWTETKNIFRNWREKCVG